MGRGRGKGKKKLTAVSSNDDPGSGAEDSMPGYKRRGKHQKPLKDDGAEEDEVEKLEEEETKPDPKKLQENPPAVSENRKKRKRNPRIKEKTDSKTDENGGLTSGNQDSVKPNGFRQMGSRRKGKPRRAAEAVVECK